MATAIQYGFSRVVPKPGYALVLRLPDDADPETFYANVVACGERQAYAGDVNLDSLRPSPGTRVLVEEEPRYQRTIPGNPLAVFVRLHAILAEVPT